MKKSLIVTGGTPETRDAQIDLLTAPLVTQGWKKIRVSENIKSLDRLRHAVADQIDIPGRDRRHSQDHYVVKESYLRGFQDGKPTVLILPELQGLAKKDPLQFMELMSELLTRHYAAVAVDQNPNLFRTIVTLSALPPNVAGAVQLFMGQSVENALSPAELFARFFEVRQLKE